MNVDWGMINIINNWINGMTELGFWDKYILILDEDTMGRWIIWNDNCELDVL